MKASNWAGEFLRSISLGMTGAMAAGTLLNWRTAPRLSAASSPRSFPRVSLLIPARNEADHLARLLPQLARIDYHPLEVIILDDHSTDGTAEVVRSFSGTARLLTGARLPNGWTGKNWACMQLAEAATGEILIFCDADAGMKPEAVAKTVGMMQEKELTALTCLPRQRTETWAEKAVVPTILYWPILSFLPLAAISKHPLPLLSIGVGQWFAFQRETYFAVGGHAAVRQHVAEDMAFGRLIKQRGYRLGAALAPDLLETRMYRGFREVWDGFGKILFSLTGRGLWQPLAVVLGFALIFILPWLLPLLIGARGRKGWLLPFSILVGSRLAHARIFREDPGSPWLAPLGTLLVPAIAIRSWLGSRRGTLTWKGRSLPNPQGSPAVNAGNFSGTSDASHKISGTRQTTLPGNTP